MKTTTQALTAVAAAAASAAVASVAGVFPPAATADSPPPCASGQVTVHALPMLAGVGHRGVPLQFSLSPGSGACTLTGYPGVDSGASPLMAAPLIHAERTMRGYLGGLPGDEDIPPTVTLLPGHPAQALVEGLAIDPDGNQCPTYTDLLVTAPDTTDTMTVPVAIEACRLQVHPITSA